ncbi:MAG: ABC transporter substrate binding protein [Deltaproteobacteria bacterium]
MASNFTSRFFLLRLRAKVALLTLLAVLLPNQFASAVAPQPAQKVLFLYSWQSVLPANLEWDSGIRKALESTEGRGIEFHTEYLDLAHHPEGTYLQSLLNLLKTKYSGQKIDLLIPVGDLAFSFLQAHGNALFPGSPIVFCAVVKQQLEALKPPPNSSGVVAWVDVQGTLAAALKLQPKTRRVAVVGGIAKTDRALEHIAREALRPYEGQLEVTFLTDLSMAEVLQRMSSLPPRTVVIYLNMLRDSTGHDFVPLEALERVAQAANAPVYGLWETLLGHGIVGGHLMSFTEQGRLAGELGRRVLNGAKPENIPVIYEGGDVYAFDWRQLQRRGLKESALPPGSLVRFKEPSLWESHKREVIGTGAAFSVLSLLVVGLLINLGRRRRAEGSLAKRLKFETLVAELSGQFVAVEAGKVDQEIDQGIKRLVEFLGVDRGRLWQLSGPQGEFIPTHSWAAPGIRAISLPPAQRFPWIRSQMLQGIPVTFSRPDELPREAEIDRQSLLADGINSALCIPLSVGGKFIGALTLSALRSLKAWDPGLAQELRPIGEIFANALIRSVADNELQQGELKYRIVADFTYDWEYWQNPDGIWRYVSPACERISGHRPAEFLKRPGLLRDLIVPEDQDRWDRHNCVSQKDPSGRELQFRIRRPDGSIRWIEHACQPVTDDAGKFIGVRASNRDITERRQAEISEQQHREQLAHMTRVATLGELTASLAHEVNQPLNAVMNNAQAALRFLHRENPDMQEVGEALGDIVRDGKRAAEVIQRLRQFLRPGEMHAQAVDINQVIEETAALTRNEFQASNIRIRFSLADNLPPVWADGIQIQQVVLNLLMNAKEAMEQAGSNPRELLVRTEQEDGETVKVSFRDRGPGMTSENLEKIFEPFYTTKTAGMGLGLAISRSIIASLGGRVWAAPNPDQGATLAFALPIFKEEHR